MINITLFAFIVAMSIYYHIIASRQMKNGGFKDHLKVDPQILVIALINLIAITVALVINILAWNSLLVWLPLLVFAVIWFVFTLASLTKKLTPKDELFASIGIEFVVLWSIVAIVLQFV
ncbi:MAG: hypothetical protein KA140_00960 [Caldisericia bacterium]|nr:hypothetical protein [Caldisericia bacterium]